jgi:hypothetical protein
VVNRGFGVAIDGGGTDISNCYNVCINGRYSICHYSGYLLMWFCS